MLFDSLTKNRFELQIVLYYTQKLSDKVNQCLMTKKMEMLGLPMKMITRNMAEITLNMIEQVPVV